MQRRDFIQHAGLAAAVTLPTLALAGPFDGNPLKSAGDTQWQLLSEEAGGSCRRAGPCQRGTMKLRVQTEALSPGIVNQTRLWFDTDVGRRAFEVASIGRNGSSQSLSFVADAERLLAIECDTRLSPDRPSESAQMSSSGDGIGYLGEGRHWLVLSPSGESIADPTDHRVLARIRFDVSVV